MLIGEKRITFLDNLDRYLTSGEYSGDVVDLMLSTLVNALRVSLVLLMLTENFPLRPYFPKTG